MDRIRTRLTLRPTCRWALLALFLVAAACTGDSTNAGIAQEAGSAGSAVVPSSADVDTTNPPSSTSTSTTAQSTTEASTEADPNKLSVDPDDIMITFSRSTTVGTCFRAINGVEPALPVPCFEQHNAEMFYVGDIPGDAESPDPGIAAAESICGENWVRITGEKASAPSVVTQGWRRPTEDSWAEGDRALFCYAAYPGLTSEAFADIDVTRSFGLVTSTGFQVGDCIENIDDPGGDFPLVDCSEPHVMEVYGIMPLEDGPYPGSDQIDRITEEFCTGPVFEEFIGIPSKDSVLVSQTVFPTEQTWPLTTPAIKCLVHDRSTRTSSLRDSQQ